MIRKITVIVIEFIITIIQQIEITAIEGQIAYIIIMKIYL
jgi:hypothetical protein